MDTLEFIETKRTYRKFKQTQIPDKDLDLVLKAGHLSSTGGNKQGLKFVAVRKPENVKKVNSYVKWAAYLPESVGTPKEDEIPVAFIAVLQDTSVSNPNDTDAGIAIGNMTSLAWSLGIGTCIMGAINRPEIKKMLGLPEEVNLHSVIACGYPLKKSYTVEMKDDIKYYLDGEGNTCVPKRKYEDVVSYFD